MNTRLNPIRPGKPLSARPDYLLGSLPNGLRHNQGDHRECGSGCANKGKDLRQGLGIFESVLDSGYPDPTSIDQRHVVGFESEYEKLVRKLKRMTKVQLLHWLDSHPNRALVAMLGQYGNNTAKSLVLKIALAVVAADSYSRIDKN